MEGEYKERYLRDYLCSGGAFNCDRLFLSWQGSDFSKKG